ncbi:hypothetical protein C8A01DRAFT_20784 [Parachaetomium inaequale]|uniref:Uncharacterized protein n=1 Tax=Parachaetomium inaequale TaxID=2588326 RepID=A0AAN6P5F6_9PEZI|nr:hypothetical protein C8A01DRAFT_20784 [Parachaetomium inaequale]
MSYKAVYTLQTSFSTPQTLTILLEYVEMPKNIVVDTQTHTITMHRGENQPKATIEVTSGDGRTASEEVYLEHSSVVCIDFLPRVFDSSVLPMYAISPDRVVVFMQPFAAGMDPLERPVVRFEGGMFENEFGRRIPVETNSEGTDVSGGGQSGVEGFREALARLFGDVAVKWGTQQTLRG